MPDDSNIQSENRLKKVAIIYSYVKREFFPTEEQYITEKDAYNDALKIADEIHKLGIETVLIPGKDSIIEELNNNKPDMVFNFVDSVGGLEYLSSTIPGILDMMDIPFTGAGVLGLALTFNKFLSKQLLQSARIPVPNFQLMHTPTDVLDPNLRFPLISKLNEIHGAVEINDTAVSENDKQLRERLSYLIKTYKQPILVEEFITGREVVGYVLQGVNTKIYLAEKIFNKGDKKYLFATFDDQWTIKPNPDVRQDPYYYQKYDDPMLKDYIKRAFDITDMLDYGKFDIRIDQSGRYYFIDLNANPAFGPKESCTAMGYIIQDLYGIPFQEILKRLVNNTMGSNYYVDNMQTNGN